MGRGIFSYSNDNENMLNHRGQMQKKKQFANNLHHKQSEFIFGSKVLPLDRDNAADVKVSRVYTQNKLDPITAYWDQYKK